MSKVLSKDNRELLRLVLNAGKVLNDEDLLARTLSEFGSDPMAAVRTLNKEFCKLERRQPTGGEAAVESFRDVSDESFLTSLRSPSQFSVSDDRRGHPPAKPEIEKPATRDIPAEVVWDSIKNTSFL